MFKKNRTVEVEVIKPGLFHLTQKDGSVDQLKLKKGQVVEILKDDYDVFVSEGRIKKPTVDKGKVSERQTKEGHGPKVKENGPLKTK